MSGADTGDLEDEYTDGGSVKWGKVAGGIAGIGLSVIGYTYASGIRLVRDGATAVVDGIGSFYAVLVSTPFTAGSEQFDRAAQTAADGLAVFGPLAFPVAVLIAVGMLLLLFWGVGRYV
ncbi:hypothetical protein [Halobellus rarus]|uniref:Uncharacterized protein n=1 Tax=Halobellus rarus TaxID=1126237 RepID=A0ABD6CT83_9EURY|nr:hypothetical protein [Halobellus rarus]